MTLKPVFAVLGLGALCLALGLLASTLVRQRSTAGGIAITASHNPAEWNAYKFFDEQGSFLSKEQNLRLLEIAGSGKFRRASFRTLGKVTKVTTALERHIERVLAHVDVAAIAARHFRGLDFGHGQHRALHRCFWFGRNRHPTDPSNEIATRLCASMANSIGRACSTSRQKPLTTRATASSSSMPRDRQ